MVIPSLGILETQRCQLRYRLRGGIEVVRVFLHAKAFVTHRLGGGKRRAGPRERIEKHAFAERQDTAHQLPQKSLRLQAGMWRQIPFRSTGRCRLDYISERALRGDSAKSTGSPFPKVVLNPPVYRLSENKPRLPHRAWHDAYVRELDMRSFWTISATHSHYQSCDFASPLKTGL